MRYENLRSKRDEAQARLMAKDKDAERDELFCDVDSSEERKTVNDACTQCDLADTQGEVLFLKEKVSVLDLELKERNKEIYKLREENAKLKERKFSFNSVKESREKLKFFTGIPALPIFLWIVELVKDKIKHCNKHLSLEDHILIVLMKLRLGLLNKDLAHRFGCGTTVYSKFYRVWLPGLSHCLKKLVVWPCKMDVKLNLPQSFQRKYQDCIYIIDCTEIFIERPKNVTARAQTWSNYKHNNTIKYLIGISSAGAITFLSQGWGGRVSDKQITLDSGFLSKVQNGDCILADRGFLIEDELHRRGAYLKLPKFTKGKDQLAASDVHTSRQLSNVRIHVERVIGQLKKFRLIQNTIPISQVDMLDDVMKVISALINLNKSVVSVL